MYINKFESLRIDRGSLDLAMRSCILPVWGRSFSLPQLRDWRPLCRELSFLKQLLMGGFFSLVHPKILCWCSAAGCIWPIWGHWEREVDVSWGRDRTETHRVWGWIEGERGRSKVWEQNLLLDRELRQSGVCTDQAVVSTHQPGESHWKYLLLRCHPETRWPPRQGNALCSPVVCCFLC